VGRGQNGSRRGQKLSLSPTGDEPGRKLEPGRGKNLPLLVQAGHQSVGNVSFLGHKDMGLSLLPQTRKKLANSGPVKLIGIKSGPGDGLFGTTGKDSSKKNARLVTLEKGRKRFKKTGEVQTESGDRTCSRRNHTTFKDKKDPWWWGRGDPRTAGRGREGPRESVQRPKLGLPKKAQVKRQLLSRPLSAKRGESAVKSQEERIWGFRPPQKSEGDFQKEKIKGKKGTPG